MATTSRLSKGLVPSRFLSSAEQELLFPKSTNLTVFVGVHLSSSEPLFTRVATGSSMKYFLVDSVRSETGIRP